MEDILRVLYNYAKYINYRLNPCFNGRYSQRNYGNSEIRENEHKVLILVLMEDILRGVLLLSD